MGPIGRDCILQSFAPWIAAAGHGAVQDVRRPTGINIFQLCKALLDGHAEKLSEKVLLHDGPVHIFDVCLQHDLWSIACEMASRGVEGCELQMQHLGPFKEEHPQYEGACTCMGWDECEYCCWGFPVHQGTWMPDFDVKICGAGVAASKAVGRTWVRECLRMASSGEKFPFAVSDGATARLLDIAILSGNQKAAKELAAKCKVLPLRRWRSDDFFSRCGEMFCVQDVLVAALAAGVCLQDLWADTYRRGDEALSSFRRFTRTHIPFREGVLLLSSSTWKQCADFMPQSPRQRQEPWKPADGNNLAPFFFDVDKDRKGQIDLEKIRLGMEAGLDLKCITGIELSQSLDDSYDFWFSDEGWEGRGNDVCCTLLDLCILTGQIQAARYVAAGPLRQFDRIKQAFLSRQSAGNRRNSFWMRCDADFDDYYADAVSIAVASPNSCLLAAGAAAKAALRASFKHHARVIYQTNRDASAKKNMKNIPTSVVNEILAFSVEAPAWIDKLNLWKEVDGWRDSASTIPSTQFQDSGADTGAIGASGATKVPSEESGLEPHAQQPGTLGVAMGLSTSLSGHECHGVQKWGLPQKLGNPM